MYIFISGHRYSDFKIYRKRRIGSLALKAYEHWVLNDGTDGSDGSDNEDGNGGRQLPNQGHGGQQNVGGQLPNQGHGGDRMLGGRCLIRDMGGTKPGGEGGEGEESIGGREGGIGVMVWSITITLIFINF